jgi:oligoribonuclease (3'-5' exoribonuclease)
VDVETTGLEKDRYQILSIGAIIEDTSKKLPFDEIPKFHAAILHNEIMR